MQIETKPPQEKVEDLLGLEIERSRERREPVSRMTLARILHEQLGVPQRDAETMVERYCEEKNPALPEYLSDEFGRPYLKVLAVVNVLLAIALIAMAVFVLRRPVTVWAAYGSGTLFLVTAVFCWVGSLKPAKRGKRRRR